MVDRAAQHDTDLELLARWREERDAEAFRELVARHAAMVHASCRRILGNAADAQEVSQECFLRLAQEGVDVRSSLAGYLHHLALGLAKNRVQSESRRRRRERAAAPRLTSSAEPGWNEVQVHVDEAIDALPEETRGIIVARYLEQETIESIAARFGLTHRQASYRAEKGIEAVHRHLRRKGIGLGAALLASLLAERALTAAPEELVRALGKRALAGEVKLALPAVAASGGTLAAKTLLGAAAAIILLLAGTAALFDADERPPELASVDPGLGTATREPQDARDVGVPAEPEDAAAAPIAAAPPATGAPQELSVDVLWAHSEKPATGSEVLVRDRSTGSTRRGHVELDGRAKLPIPEEWSAATVVVENVGADPITVEVEFPAAEPLPIRLVPIHAVAGSVTDRETGAPIVGAEFRIGRAEFEIDFTEFDTATSGPGGEFELLLPSRERFEIHVRADGYADRRPLLAVTVRGTSALDVQLDPAFEVLARVLDVQGVPLSGVSVVANGSGSDLWMVFLDSDRVLTNAAGEALVGRISRRTPQELQFTHEGFREASLQPDPVNRSMTRVEHTVVLERDARSPRCVEGVITDAGGRPLEGIHIRWRHSLDVRFSGGGFEDPGVTTVTDSSGRYRVQADDVDGECVIAVAGDGWAPVVRSGIRSGPPERPGRFDLALEPANWLAGRVVDETGRPVVNARIVVTPRGGGLPLHCDVYPEVSSETRSDEQGLFSLANLPPPPLDIEVEPPENRSLVWRDPGDIPTNREVELVLHSIGEIRGRVVDAASGAAVAAFSIRR
jgi:RNA polymerase sigma-70 factor (ECF subfamily)